MRIEDIPSAGAGSECHNQRFGTQGMLVLAQVMRCIAKNEYDDVPLSSIDVTADLYHPDDDGSEEYQRRKSLRQHFAYRLGFEPLGFDRSPVAEAVECSLDKLVTSWEGVTGNGHPVTIDLNDFVRKGCCPAINPVDVEYLQGIDVDEIDGQHVYAEIDRLDEEAMQRHRYGDTLAFFGQLVLAFVLVKLATVVGLSAEYAGVSLAVMVASHMLRYAYSDTIACWFFGLRRLRRLRCAARESGAQYGKAIADYERGHNGVLWRFPQEKGDELWQLSLDQVLPYSIDRETQALYVRSIRSLKQRYGV